MSACLWMCAGIVSTFLVAMAGAFECTETASVLTPRTRDVTDVSSCLLECTHMMYVKKLQLQDQRNIRLKDPTEGEQGEYCWSREIKCNVGERFQRAFVLLPVDLSTVGELEVKATAPGAAAKLHVHRGPTTVADDCGLRYDVTEHFSSAGRETSFCVQVVSREGDRLGDSVLRCPPLLVTFWRRPPNRVGSDQQGGG